MVGKTRSVLDIHEVARCLSSLEYSESFNMSPNQFRTDLFLVASLLIAISVDAVAR